MIPKTMSLSVALMALLLTVACLPPARYNAPHAAPPAPCTVPVNPITYNSLVVSISVNYTYNAKDPTQARPWHQEDVLEHLNSLGKPDGNSFSFQNGNPVNFYLCLHHQQ